MLNFLQIRNYAIVDSLDLEFAPGFTCVTGETGAGKSILVDALSLLCGKRADTAAIRSGAEKAELTAEFEIPANSPAGAWLKEAGLDNGGTCVLRRMVSEAGRSRAWINGTVVTLQQLDNLGELLVEIHGQNEHMLLVRKDEQYRLLDGSGDYGKELNHASDCYFAWEALSQEKQSLLRETPLDSRDKDLLRYQIEELEDNLVTADKFLELEAEHRVLARGGDIVEALDHALQSLEAEETGAGAMLHAAATRLDEHAGLDREIAGAAGLLREAAINCNEAQNSIQSALSRLDLSPERLAELEQILGRQHDLARKHRVEPEYLQQVLDQMKERFERAGSLEDRLTRLDLELENSLQAYRSAAAKLHSHRKSHADRLAAAVTGLMQELGMEGGLFEFSVQLDREAPPTSRGSDRLELLVSANPGVPPGPLRKVASGGELSRISLAIKVAAQSGAAAPTQIFDEVDAGIGGDTANAVGALLKSLSSSGQALCVTHLAQVAACADQQLQVQKLAGNSGIRVETRLLDELARVDEIARMLGGRVSEQSRAHASEMLATASTRH